MSGHEAFGVDLEALGQAEKGIREAVEELGTEGAWLLTQNLGAVGHDGLADALVEFRESWHWAFRELVDDGRSAADALRDTREWYKQVDEQVRNSLTDMWDGVTGDPMGQMKSTTDADYTAEDFLEQRAAAAQAQQNFNRGLGWD